MKTTVKIEYTDMVVPPRCRKPRPHDCEAEITVDIRAVAASDAPVAFIVTEYDHEPRKVRLYKGKLYRQVQDRQLQYKETNRRDENRPFWENKTAWQVSWQWLLTTHFGVYHRQNRYWDMGSLDWHTDYARKKAASYIIVDGNAYERTGEPYYSVTCFGLGCNHGGTGFFVSWADYRDRKAIWGMSPLHKDGAIDIAVAIALGRGDTESVEHIRSTFDDIRVLIPGAVKRRYARHY